MEQLQNKDMDIIKNKISDGKKRSVLLKRNIIFSFFLKGVSILINFILVPLTINFVNTEQYGIWLTLSSIVAWISFFDIGFTHGLRNKLAEALAFNNIKLAKSYVSTTYAVLSIIFFILWLVFIIISPFINWSGVLNVSPSLSQVILYTLIIVYTYFSLLFILKIINIILFADQKPAYASLIDLLGQLLSLIIIYVMTQLLSGSLLLLCVGLCVAPVLVTLFSSFYLFRFKYRHIAPNFRYVNFSCLNDLIKLGVKFFIIQIAAIIQFQTANLLIARIYNMDEVTNYNIAYKYFSILNMIFAIILSPFWSASTEAFLKKDFLWIKSILNKYNKSFFILSLLGVLMLFFSNYVYNIWIGKIVSIPLLLSLCSFVFAVSGMYSSPYVNFLNGIGALKIQFYVSLITPVLFIILVLILCKYFRLGVYAVFIASTLSNFYGYILAPIQCKRIINGRARGIWIN